MSLPLIARPHTPTNPPVAASAPPTCSPLLTSSVRLPRASCPPSLGSPMSKPTTPSASPVMLGDTVPWDSRIRRRSAFMPPSRKIQMTAWGDQDPQSGVEEEKRGDEDVDVDVDVEVGVDKGTTTTTAAPDDDDVCLFGTRRSSINTDSASFRNRRKSVTSVEADTLWSRRGSVTTISSALAGEPVSGLRSRSASIAVSAATRATSTPDIDSNPEDLPSILEDRAAAEHELLFLTPGQAVADERRSKEAERQSNAAKLSVSLPKLIVQELSFERMHRLYARYRMLEDTATMPARFVHQAEAKGVNKFAAEAGMWKLIKWELQHDVRRARKMFKRLKWWRRRSKRVEAALWRVEAITNGWRRCVAKAAVDHWVAFQLAARQKVKRQAARHKKKCVKLIQRAWRAHVLFKHMMALRRAKAVLTVQAQARTYLVRREFVAQKEAAVTIQRRVKEVQMRRKMNLTVLRMQFQWRRHLRRKVAAAKWVQRWWRHLRWRRETPTLRETVLLLQRRFFRPALLRLAFIAQREKLKLQRIADAQAKRLRRASRKANTHMKLAVGMEGRLAVVTVPKPRTGAENKPQPLTMDFYFPATATHTAVPVDKRVFVEHKKSSGYGRMPSCLSRPIISHVLFSTHVRRSATDVVTAADLHWPSLQFCRGKMVQRLATTLSAVRIGGSATPADQVRTMFGRTPVSGLGVLEMTLCRIQVYRFGWMVSLRIHDNRSTLHTDLTLDARTLETGDDPAHASADTDCNCLSLSRQPLCLAVQYWLMRHVLLCRSCMTTTHRAAHKAGQSVALTVQEATQHHAAKIIQRNIRNRYCVSDEREELRQLALEVYRKEYNLDRAEYDYRNERTEEVLPFFPWSLRPTDIEPIPGWQRRVNPADGSKYYFDAVTGRKSRLNDEEAAVIVQARFRGYLHRHHVIDLATIVKAVKFHNHARMSYFRDPDDFKAGLNYALLIHLVEQNAGGAMKLYTLLMKDRPKNKTLLTAFGLFMLAECMDDREQALSQGYGMIQYSRAHQTDYSHFELAGECYFKFAVVANGQSYKSHVNMGLYCQFVLERPDVAEFYFRKALEVSPCNANALTLLAELLRGRHAGGMFPMPGPPVALVKRCVRVAFNSRTRRAVGGGSKLKANSKFKRFSWFQNGHTETAAADKETRARRPENVLVIPDAVLEARGWAKMYDPAAEDPGKQNFWYNEKMDVTAWRRPTFHPYNVLPEDIQLDLEDMGFEPTPEMIASGLLEE